MEDARTLAEKILPWSQIVGTLLIPVAIAFVGFFIQRSIAQQSTKATYTELAISILNRELATEADQGLRDFAIGILKENSPTTIEPYTLEQLRTGNTNLPSLIKEELESLRKFEYDTMMRAAQESFRENERRREINNTWPIHESFVGYTRDSIEELINSRGGGYGTYTKEMVQYAYQNSSQPKDTVIGQYPTPEESPRIKPGTSILLILSDGIEGAE